MQVYIKLKSYLITDNLNKISRVLYKGKNHINTWEKCVTPRLIWHCKPKKSLLQNIYIYHKREENDSVLGQFDCASLYPSQIHKNTLSS